MFFKSNPVPEEWSHLTPLEIKLCRKAQRKYNSLDCYRLCRKAIEQKAFAALPIILPMVGYPWDIHLFTYIFHEQNRECRESVLPALSSLSDESQRGFLGQQQLAENTVYLAKVLEQIDDINVRAGAVCAHLGSDNRASEQLCGAYLDAGVNVHYDSGQMLRLAVQKGKFGIAQKILDSGFDLDTFGTAVYQKLVGDGASPEAINWFKKRMARADMFEGMQDGETPVNGVFGRVGKDGVARTDALPNGASLTTVFNFSSGQQMIYVSEGQSLSAPAVTNISHTQNSRLLEQAIAAFLAQDGDPDLVAGVTARQLGDAGTQVVANKKAIVCKPTAPPEKS